MPRKKDQRGKQPTKSRSGLRDYIVQTLKVAEKPGWEEVWSTFKVTVTGFLIVGVIGFLFQLTALYLVGG
ncbi:MAG: protein translocase SEC61 complex subunit gamma [Candidatus Korarchaeota archaeon]|nr:protein translocase SEC61 complex subunit gamma [Candidatus Korarchaeota archaeon]